MNFFYFLAPCLASFSNKKNVCENHFYIIKGAEWALFEKPCDLSFLNNMAALVVTYGMFGYFGYVAVIDDVVKVGAYLC